MFGHKSWLVFGMLCEFFALRAKRNILYISCILFQLLKFRNLIFQSCRVILSWMLNLNLSAIDYMEWWFLYRVKENPMLFYYHLGSLPRVIIYRTLLLYNVIVINIKLFVDTLGDSLHAMCITLIMKWEYFLMSLLLKSLQLSFMFSYNITFLNISKLLFFYIFYTLRLLELIILYLYDSHRNLKLFSFT